MNAISASAPQVVSNAITYSDLEAVATSLGADAGKGRDTQIKFLLKIVEGAYHNAIDLKPNKHGLGVDDCTKLAEAYVKAQGTATIFDAKAANQRKLISCLRTSAKLGQWPKGGNGEPLATVNNLISMRQNLRKDPAQAKKLDDAANTLLKYARAQVKLDQLIDDRGLRDFCYKPEAQPRTAEEIIESARNQLEKLIAGRNGPQDLSPTIKSAKDLLTSRLKEIATARGNKAGPCGPAKLAVV